jgi:hypothetical protein
MHFPTRGYGAENLATGGNVLHLRHPSRQIEERETGIAGFLGELGVDVIGEFLPDSIGLIGILFYAAVLVLLVLIWAGRRFFDFP